MLKTAIRFGPFHFHKREYRLFRDGEPVKIQGKALDLLDFLVEHAGELVLREEVFEALWPGTFVSDDALFQAVRKLRRALGDDPRSPTYVQTVPGKGYRFLAEIASEAPATLTTASEPGNLRAADSSFVGRDEPRSRLRSLVSEHRLVTITGPGGMGKTTLARQLAVALDGEDYGPRWFCDVSGSDDLASLIAAVVEALEIGDCGAKTATEAQEKLSEQLGRLGPMLVILDNVEQVVDPAAEAVVSWLHAAPALRLVLTSRERLRVANEHVLELGPLPFEDAVSLFRQRALAAGLSDPEDDVINELVARLDGMPLAIELAAARCRVFSPSRLLKRLDDRLAVLAGGRRDGPSRHNSLRTALDVSWELLTPEQQQTLARCAVFRGGFTPEAAEGVLESPDALELVSELRDRSLLQSREGRLDLYETVRQYGQEKLDILGIREAAEARHLAWVVSMAATILTTPAGEVALESDNARAASKHAKDPRDRVACAEVLVEGSRAASPWESLATLLDELVVSTEAASPELRAQALILRGGWALDFDHLDRALEDANLAVELSHREPGLLGRAQRLLGATLARGKDLTGGLERIEAALALHQQVDSPTEQAQDLLGIGSLNLRLSHFEKSLDAYGEAVEIFRALGLHQRAALALLKRTIPLSFLQRLDEKARDLEHVLGVLQHTGRRQDLARVHHGLGVVHSCRGHNVLAKEHFQRSLNLRRQGGWAVRMAEKALAQIAYREGRYDDAERLFARSESEVRLIGGQALAEHVEGWVVFEVQRGRYQAAEARALEARELYTALGIPAGAGAADLWLALISALRGDVEAATALSRSVASLLPDQPLRLWQQAEELAASAVPLARGLADSAQQAEAFAEVREIFVSVRRAQPDGPGGLAAVSPPLRVYMHVMERAMAEAEGSECPVLA